jgi:asparagine synthase (glutamine-hydrolysing)
VEVRYPFLDLRIVNYVLSLPPFPWTFRKTLLRESMTGHLPDSVRLRRKTPLAGDPLLMMLQRPEASWMMDEAQVGWGDAMEQYVNRAALPPLRGKKTAEFARVAIRPLCLTEQSSISRNPQVSWAAKMALPQERA